MILKMKIKSLLLLLLIFCTACKKNMDELNVNPNSPPYSNPDYLFTFSVTKGMASYNTNVYLHYWTLMNWNMYFATLGGVDPGKEYDSNEGKNSFWNEVYSQGLINAQEVIRLTENDPALINKTAIAKIWKSYLFQQLTDLWGNIPYSEALNGNTTLSYSPKYDTQESIYTALLIELKNAVAVMDVSKPSFAGTSDPIYNGSVSQWKAFANSLRLRLASRLRYVNPEKAQEEITNLQSQAMIGSNSDNARFPYNNELKNPLYEVIQRGENGGKTYPSKFLIDKLKTDNDPRLKIFAKVTIESQLIGMPDYYGVPNLVPSNSTVWNNYNNDASNISQIGNWFYRIDAPGMLMTYSEVCFLQSEAALQGWWPGSAQQLYETGVRANMESYTNSGITSSEINTAIAALPAVTLENIITQKWISFTYQNGYEAFAEYRRTGFPVYKDYNGAAIDQTNFPNRLVYPATEISLNADHYNETISIQGADNAGTKIWWDIN